jgi:hypothetical protein
MSVTPLYNLEEINAEIAQAKKDLATAREALTRRIDTSGISRSSQRESVKNLQDHLVWLQSQRAALEIGPGTQSVVGRPSR